MRYDLVIFDLDGTVLDTLSDLVDATNATLAARGLPTHTREEVRRMIGNGVTNQFRRAMPDGTPEAEREAAIAEYKAIYAKNLNVHTLPYSGMPELLRDLRGAGVRTAVNTNKMADAAQTLCAAHYDGLLDALLGERAGMPKKPSPEGALRLMARFGVPPERTLYVGDSDTDLMTAANAGIDGAWVSWGYRHRDELGGIEVSLAFDTVDALRDYLFSE